MIDSDMELLDTITKKAPWLIEGTETYAPAAIREDSHQVIDDIRDYHLTIIANTGRVYREFLTIKIVNGRLELDKPCKWLDTTASFHVFFRSQGKGWNFFLVAEAECGQDIISAGIPDTIYSLLKRRHRRIPVPAGTKAIFKNHNNLIDIVYVKNISEGGMLIFDNSSLNKYPINSIINEIFLTIPPDDGEQETSNAHRVLPFITNGKVVRVFRDENSSVAQYGVAFQHEAASLYKRFNQVVTDLENHLRKGVSF